MPGSTTPPWPRLPTTPPASATSTSAPWPSCRPRTTSATGAATFGSGSLYAACLRLVPHRKFTFAKLWLMAAQLEVRQGDVAAARKLLGRAIGMCPKDKLFTAYLDLERKLFDFDRCRKLHQKHVEFNAANCQAWIRFAQLEQALDDVDRARAIFELAVAQPQLDMPELLWKAYIDFEDDEGQHQRTRALYERLLDKTHHVKVWISYAHFEINFAEPQQHPDDQDELPVSDDAKARARAIFQRAHDGFRARDAPDERAQLLSAWLAFEKTHGSPTDIDAVQRQMPRRTRRRRQRPDDSWEEYIDYVFPADHDDQARGLANLLAKAQQWKQTGGGLSAS
ncbi:hypothetical protein CDD81_3502 [Ophiocordyceps australis]|uniref:Pre-mRNA-splicing factor Syf1/CRNKL1-like C-terminal HAT-repeats domain-containing protein n=1 Tax=Ophiocordyceps australis TaxID=1399860 RepID=A0A2C5XPT5_9HYPO|nr:hypothetical protein CDD81_3502 [Ophiocordyceps australis]